MNFKGTTVLTLYALIILMGVVLIKIATSYEKLEAERMTMLTQYIDSRFMLLENELKTVIKDG